MNLTAKEQQLIDKINKAKEALSQIKLKQQVALGKLACQYGLDQFDQAIIAERFKQLSQELLNE